MTLSSQISGNFMSSRMPYREERGGEKNTTKTPVKNHEPEVLRNHHITGRMRAKMIDWLLEITDAYHLCH